MLSPQPKPERRVTTKRRKQRQAAKVVTSVRAQCVERDGYCRIGNWRALSIYDLYYDWYGRFKGSGSRCKGCSEWAHLGDKKRFKTRGQPPEKRHTTAGSLMLCKFHHVAYDAGDLGIIGRNANKPLKFKWVSGTRYRSVT